MIAQTLRGTLFASRKRPLGRRSLDKRGRNDAGHKETRFAKFGVAAAAGGPDEAEAFPEHDFLSLVAGPVFKTRIV